MSGQTKVLPGFIAVTHWLEKSTIYIKVEAIAGFRRYGTGSRLSHLGGDFQVSEAPDQITALIREAQGETGIPTRFQLGPNGKPLPYYPREANPTDGSDSQVTATPEPKDPPREWRINADWHDHGGEKEYCLEASGPCLREGDSVRFREVREGEDQARELLNRAAFALIRGDGPLGWAERESCAEAIAAYLGKDVNPHG